MKNKEYFKNTKINLIHLTGMEKFRLMKFLEKLNYHKLNCNTNVLAGCYLYIFEDNIYMTGNFANYFVNSNLKEIKYNNIFTSFKHKLK